MQAISSLALEKHTGPYEKWPSKTRLLINGEHSAHKVNGYEIEAQYQTTFGILLITSYDCPFEEANDFYLLDGNGRPLSHCLLSAPYGSFLLNKHWPLCERTLALHYYDDLFYTIEVTPPGRWWRRQPWLKLQNREDWQAIPSMVEAKITLDEKLKHIL